MTCLMLLDIGNRRLDFWLIFIVCLEVVEQYIWSSER